MTSLGLHLGSEEVTGEPQVTKCVVSFSKDGK